MRRSRRCRTVIPVHAEFWKEPRLLPMTLCSKRMGSFAGCGIFEVVCMIGEWNPFEEAKAPPESVRIFGVDVRVGDRVRLCPTKQADIMDIALAGKIAFVEAIEQDFEENIH